MTVARMPALRPCADAPAHQLAGRAAELAAARGRLERPSGPVSAIVVEGGPGIGKTAFAAQLADDAARIGWTVLTGEAAPDADQTPFGTFFDAFGPIEVLDVLPAAREWCADASEAQRQRVYRAVRTALADCASGRGVALVLDDVHRADPESVRLITALLRHPPAVRLAVVLCSHPERMPAAVERALAGRVERIRLGPLDADAVAALCAPASPLRRKALLAASRGNPRYLRILTGLPTAAVAGLSSAAPPAPVRLPDGLDAELAAELGALPRDERTVAAAAALLGHEVDLELVTAVADLPADRVAAATDRLAGRGALVSDGGRLRFGHPLVRAAAYRLGDPAWRIAAHARAGAELRRRSVAETRLAPHVAASARLGDLAAAQLLGRAARIMLHRDAAVAARWLEVALHVLPDSATALRDELSLLLARGYLQCGRCELAPQLLRELSAPLRDAAEVTVLLAQCERGAGHLDEAAALLRAGLGRPGVEPATDAAARLELAGLDIARGQQPGDLDTLVWGVAGVPPALGAAAAILVAITRAGGPAATVAADHAAELTDALHDDELVAMVGHIHLLAWAEYHADRPEAARRHVDRARAAAARCSVREPAPCLAIVSAALAGRAGRLDAALTAAAEALELATDASQLEHQLAATAVGLLPTLWRDGPVAAQAMLARMPRPNEPISPWLRRLVAGWAAETLLEIGKIEDAAAQLDLALATGCGPDDPQSGWLLGLAAAVELQRGDIETATSRVAAARRCGSAEHPPQQQGAGLLAAARLALATGDPVAAAADARAAVAALDRAAAPIAAAQARRLLADAELAAGDPRSAQLDLAAAKRTFESYGANWLATLATNAQRRAGATVPRSATGISGLSQREREIAGLLGDGLTNRAIADRLVISVRTVDCHVARILGKLGVSSRAAVARRLATAPPV